jgi:hypothetical protein
MYQVLMFNPHYDDQFFISHFIKGLKLELRSAVDSQVPDTLARAFMLAWVQQEVLDDAKQKGPQTYGRTDTPASKFEAAPKPRIKVATGEFWKDRQLRDFRRANGQFFKCGEKYDPTHQCGQKATATVNLMEHGECPIQLSEEVLNLIEMHDIAIAEQLSLSLHAMSGSEGDNCLRLRAMVGNQVMLILVDSGSSNCFINANMIKRIQCTVKETTPMLVKVANGEYMQTSKIVPDLTWWSHGATFTTPMRVLDLGGYDAILGMDWLKLHSPMTTDWDKKFLSFPYQGKQVTLHGVPPTTDRQMKEIPVEQLAKWTKGNDVWVIAVIHSVPVLPDATTTPAYLASISSLLTEFSSVFFEPTELPPQRQYDHAITLKPDATPFNSRPYRYSPAHKDEIQRQVAEMLAAGIITPSMSPFASPVLLVQKRTDPGDFVWIIGALMRLQSRMYFQCM